MTTNHPVPTPPPAEPAPSLRPVEELQALCDAATPPVDGSTWVIERHGGAYEIYSGPLSKHSEDIAVGIYREENARFIAAARTALPSLLARLRAAEETLAAVRDRLERSDWIVARELLRLVDASARCRHCGALPDSDGDHSCSCPNPDSTCAEHPVTEGASR